MLNDQIKHERVERIDAALFDPHKSSFGQRWFVHSLTAVKGLNAMPCDAIPARIRVLGQGLLMPSPWSFVETRPEALHV
jgi:hypothetical protein